MHWAQSSVHLSLLNGRLEIANPICKHIAKAPQANAKTKALSKSLQMPAQVTALQVGFRFAHAQKNKINLCFVARLVRFDRTVN
jgi:hypothetical protein